VDNVLGPRPSTCDAQRAAPREAARTSSTMEYMRGAQRGIELGTTIKYLRRTTRQRPGHHDQVPATHNERRRWQRPEPVPGITDAPTPQAPRFRLVLCVPPPTTSRVALPRSGV
jgi:hypothetical protein